jgi:hypothetical protein
MADLLLRIYWTMQNVVASTATLAVCGTRPFVRSTFLLGITLPLRIAGSSKRPTKAQTKHPRLTYRWIVSYISDLGSVLTFGFCLLSFGFCLLTFGF